MSNVTFLGSSSYVLSNRRYSLICSTILISKRFTRYTGSLRGIWWINSNSLKSSNKTIRASHSQGTNVSLYYTTLSCRVAHVSKREFLITRKWFRNVLVSFKLTESIQSWNGKDAEQKEHPDKSVEQISVSNHTSSKLYKWIFFSFSLR